MDNKNKWLSLLKQSQKHIGITICALLLSANTIYADSATLFNIKTTTLTDAIEQLNRESEYTFLYRADLFNNLDQHAVNLQQVSVLNFLNEVLEPLGFDYTLQDNTIIIREGKETDITPQQRANASLITIHGVVTDSDGNPMPGVTVSIVGTPGGVITDIAGEYTMKVKPKSILAYSFIGMTTQKINVEQKREINVALKSETQNLESVVVVGFGKQKKESVIGSLDQVEPAELKLPTRTISTSLSGRLAGVITTQKSGEPGYDGADFWIRGVNTFNGSSTPLVLIDNVERSLDDIDPEEIANFTILKDATATAVYGVRGANGVVLITTKKGTPGKPHINLTAENSFSVPLQLPDFVDGATYMELQNEALINEGKTPIYNNEEIENTRNHTDPNYYPDVNWIDELMKNFTLSQKVNVNVSGGSEKMRYFISGSFFNQNGIYKDFDENSFNNNINLKRYNFRSNVDADITKTTNLGINIAAILEDRRYPGEGASAIFGKILNVPPVLFPAYYPDPTKIPGMPYGQQRNPYQMVAFSGYSTEYHTTVQSNIVLDQDLVFITKGLNARLLFSFDTQTDASVQRSMKPRPYLIVPWGYDDEGNPILINEEGEYQYVDQDPADASYHDYLTRSSSSPYTDRSIYWEAQLNYNKVIGNHTMGAMVLFNENDQEFPSSGDIYDAVPKRYQGLTGRVNYSYNNRYFGEFNFAYNGSENFAPGHKYGFFPSFAVGWTASEEHFMQWMKPAVDFLKFRISHGNVGNDRIGGVAGVSRFAYLTRVGASGGNVGFGTNNGYGYGSGTGTDITYFGNQAATWETAIKTDVGMEIKFLNNFHLQFDFFREYRKDIWTALSKVPDIYGFGSRTIGDNVGEMLNLGFDGYLEYNLMKGKNFSLNARGTFSFAKNEVKATGEEKPKFAYQDPIGQPYGRPLGYVALGLFKDQAEIDNSPSQEYLGVTRPGDIKYQDVNNDGVIDDFDRIYIGHPSVPEFSYGLGMTGQYKNFDLSFLFQGAARVSFYASPKTFPEIEQNNVYKFVAEDHWTEENQNLSAAFPRLGVGSQNNNYANSTWWLQNGQYLRLKQLEVGYTLPKALLQQYGVRSFRFYFNALNLFTISKFKWWDPEIQSYSGSNYPLQQVFNLGCEFQF